MKRISMSLLFILCLLCTAIVPLPVGASTGESFMLSLLKPTYTTGYYWEFGESQNGKLGGSNSMSMGGIKYFNGFKFGEPGKAEFNLNQQYAEINGLIGLDDFENKKDTAVSFYADGKLIEFIELKAHALPKPFIIKVSGVKSLLIQKEKGYSEVDFAALKIATASGVVATGDSPENPLIANNDGPLFLDTVKAYSQGSFYWTFGSASSTGIGGNRSMTMMGARYYNGFKFGDPSYAIYNLEGKYNKLTGIIGIDDYDVKVSTSVNFFGDGVLIKSINLPAFTKPMPFEVNLTGVHQLKIEKGVGYTEVDFANLRILSNKTPTQTKPVETPVVPAGKISEFINGVILNADAYRIAPTKKALGSSVKGSGFAINPAYATTFGRQVVYQNNCFIAMGDFGMISISTNGSDWMPAYIGAFSRVTGLSYGNGHYVATCENGYMAVSKDLKQWSSIKSPATTIKSILYNKQFVALAANGVLYKSSDGLSWTKLTQILNNKTVYNFNKLLFLGNSYYVMGDTVTLQSSDLKTWSKLNIVRTYTSNNKEQATTAVRIQDMAVGNNHLLAVSNNAYFVSANQGVTWKQQSLVQKSYDKNTYIVNSIVYFNKRFIMFQRVTDGINQEYIISRADEKGNLMDIIPENARVDLEYNEIKAAVASSTLLVGVGSDIIYSKDGNVYKTTYNRAANFPSLLGANDNYGYWSNNNLTSFNASVKIGEATTQLQQQQSKMNDMAWGNGIYVAVGAEQTLHYSTDLKTWSDPYRFSNQNDDVVKRPEITSVIYYNNQFIAADRDGYLYKSVDGKEWTVESLHKDYRDLTIQYDSIGKQVMLFGAYVGPLANGETSYVGLVLTSTDGTYWKQILVPSVENIRSIAMGPNGYVLTGFLKTYAISKDLKRFDTYALDDKYSLKSTKGNLISITELRDAVYMNGKYYALATSTDRMDVNNPNFFEGRILASLDGITWSPTLEELVVSAYTLKLANDKLWLVLQNGMLVEVK